MADMPKNPIQPNPTISTPDALSLSLLYIYIYIYVCVCVCVCVLVYKCLYLSSIDTNMLLQVRFGLFGFMAYQPL